jgi:hypothetical protein
MDPISFAIELEISTLLLAAVGAVATWLNHRQAVNRRRQKERHFQEMRVLRVRQHREHMAAIRTGERVLEELPKEISAIEIKPSATRRKARA